MAAKVVNNICRIYVGGIDVSHMVHSVAVDATVGQLVTTTVVFHEAPEIAQDDKQLTIRLGSPLSVDPGVSRSIRLRVEDRTA